MHARDLVELAALVSLHGPLLIHSPFPLPRSPLQQYWSASKCRLDRWGKTLKQLADGSGQSSAASRDTHADYLRSVVEEVLTGEVLSRVWAAVLSARDQRHGGEEDGFIIARSILLGHQESRHRALTLLFHGPGVDSQQAVELNRLRRQAERWTDLLIGHLATREDVSELAAEPQRAREFARDLRNRVGAWPLVWAALRGSFAAECSLPSPNPDLNAEIAGSIVACFSPELFDSTGLLRTGWMARLWTTPHETQGLIDELFANERIETSLSDGDTGLYPAPFLRRDRPAL